MALKTLGLVILGASCFTKPATAEVGDLPIIGGIYNSSVVIKQQLLANSETLALGGRDVALFSIGGLTLDAYILTLPLKTEVKARVIKRLANPQYAIALGHFLYHFYDRYTGESNITLFNEHLANVYSAEQLANLQHSLYNPKSLNSTPENQAKDADKDVVDKELIAVLVNVYDIIFNNDDWTFNAPLADSYQYLSHSAADLALIAKVQTVLMDLLANYSQTMKAGEFKNAITAIIADNQPNLANKVNNKAQAVTITIIDFVRLNVLKSYRQYALQQHRIDKYQDWMLSAFNKNPTQLINFLQHQNKRRFGVQIAVDGLQQGLVEALVTEQTGPFINQVKDNIANAKQYQPLLEQTQSPEHKQQLNHLYAISNEAMTNEVRSDKHYLPFFKELYQYYRSSVASNGVSSTPTISVRNLPIILTGANVAGSGGTGIPNFHFVDREIDRPYYFFGNDALQLDKLVDANGVQTMFARLQFLKTLNCNAQYDWHAQISYDSLINLGAGELKRDYGEQRCLTELTRRAEAEQLGKQARLKLIELLQQYQKLSYWTPITKISKQQLIKGKIKQLAQLTEMGMPDYLLIYIPWPDHFAHFTGPFSDEIIAASGELNRLDYWLGQLQASYKKAGVYDHTLWGMAGDHGLAPVFYSLNPEVQVFEAMAKQLNIDVNIEKISSDEGEGPKITNALNYPSLKPVDVVVASTAGGNYMMDFFNSSKGWQYQPLYRELQQWRPKQLPATAPAIAMISEIAQRLPESLDYLVVREESCDLQQCKLRLVGQRDNGVIHEVIYRVGDSSFYGSLAKNQSQTTAPMLLDIAKANPYRGALNKAELAEQKNLLDLCINKAKIDNQDSWCNATQWRQLSRFSPRPDSVNQLAHLYDEDRAGTVNLFPKQGIGYNTSVPGRHAGEHYLEKDAFIGFWGTPVNSQLQLTSAANGSLAPTIFEYLSGDKVVVGENGWGFDSLLNNIIITPPKQEVKPKG